MNSKTRGLLLAFALGDGCIKLKKPYTKQNGDVVRYAELSITHSPKQLDYLKHKRDKIHSLLGGRRPKINEEKSTLKNGNSYLGYRITRAHKFLRHIHKVLYDVNGRKHINQNVLNCMFPEAWYYFWLDDGCLAKKYNKNGDISSFEARLHFYVTHKEAKTIQAYFQYHYNIHWKIAKHNKTGLFNLRANTEEANKFLELIAPYKERVPSLNYKFP